MNIARVGMGRNSHCVIAVRAFRLVGVCGYRYGMV